jgi:IclR family transcriptional regulator, acetate operon repressor
VSEPADTGPRSAVRSVERALTALDYLVSIAPRSARVTDVARHLGLSLAATSRLLATMTDSDYASRTGDRRFTLGPRSLPLAKDWMTTLSAAAEGPVARAAAATGESVMLTLLIGDTIAPVAWHPPRQRAEELAARVAEIDSAAPLWATANGRSMLGKLPPAHRSRLLAAVDYPCLTARTPASAAEVTRKINDGERTGIHVEAGEVIPDLSCCAVGLGPGPNGEVLSLSVMSFGRPDEARMYNVLRREIREVGNALEEAG